MKKNAITQAELQAYRIMTQGEIRVTGDYNSFARVREEADKFIMIAEKIKAERASASMLNSL